MKQKMTHNIRTAQDIVEWATGIVAGNGTKFSVLSKQDQFSIASFVLASVKPSTDIETLVQNECEPDPPRNQGEMPAASETEKGNCELPSSGQGRNATIGETLVGQGFSAQQAFDRFLKWTECHPHEDAVMDYSNGHRTVAAAFAYWLVREAAELPQGA